MDSTEYGDGDDLVTRLLDSLIVRAERRVGQVVREKWRLDVLLGVGGMAAVYAATHRNGSRVAVKILHEELSASLDVRARFTREGRAANAVGHDGAVKVLDDDVAEDGSLFLVTELLDGETLEDRRVRSGGRLNEDDVLSVADQLLDVLAAAHANGVLHRDIKPPNIFLTRSGQLKVLDFGIARLREVTTGSLATRSGSAMGTPAFMSPEQARGLWDEVDGRSDIWSVGATMWQTLTGTLVHQGRTANEELLSAMTRHASPLASVLPQVSPAVAQVVDKALAYEKERRWINAERMQEGVLRAYHDRHGAPITTAPKMSVPASVPNKTLGRVERVAPTKSPTTASPVASSLGSRRGPRLRLVVGAAAGAIVVIAGITWGRSRAPHDKSAATSSSSVIAPAPHTPTPEPTTATADTPVPSPVAAAPRTPTPEAVVSKPPPVVRPRAAVEPASLVPPHPANEPTPAPPAARPSCNPPYVIDPATGKKHFKVDCL